MDNDLGIMCDHLNIINRTNNVPYLKLWLKFGLVNGCSILRNAAHRSNLLVTMSTANFNDEYLVPTTSVVIIINIVCIIIAAIHNTLLLIKIIYDNKIRKELNDGHEFQLRLYYITVAMISSYTIMNILFLFTEFSWLPPNIQCKMILISIGFYYFIPKYIGWIYQITRLKIVFYDSPLFAYNRCFLNLIQSSLLFAPITITLFMIFFSYSIYDPVLSHCDLITPLWLGAFCGGIDGFASFFCIFLLYFK